MIAKGGLMPNGTPGDHPLTDMLVHGRHPFPEDIESILRKIIALEPWFPDGRRPYLDQVAWEKRFRDWALGENLDEGRQALQMVWNEMTRRPDQQE